MAKPPLFQRLLLMMRGDRAAPAVASPPAATAAPPQTRFDFSDPRIPGASQPKIGVILKTLSEIGELAQRNGNSGAGEYLDEARRIENVYLPELMASYFAIPEQHRAEIFRRTGKSASYQLNERLDTIIGELQEIARYFANGEMDKFSGNLKFIDKRFGSNDDFK